MVEKPMPCGGAVAAAGKLPMGEPSSRQGSPRRGRGRRLAGSPSRGRQRGRSRLPRMIPHASAQWRIDDTMFLPTPKAAMADSSVKVDFLIKPPSPACSNAFRATSAAAEMLMARKLGRGCPGCSLHTCHGLILAPGGGRTGEPRQLGQGARRTVIIRLLLSVASSTKRYNSRPRQRSESATINCCDNHQHCDFPHIIGSSSKPFARSARRAAPEGR